MLYKHRNKQFLIGIYTPKKKKKRINLSVNDEPLSLELGFNVDYDSGKIEKKKTTLILRGRKPKATGYVVR